MSYENLKVGQKVLVGDFDTDHQATIVSISNKIMVEVNFYGNKVLRELDGVNCWLAGVVE